MGRNVRRTALTFQTLAFIGGEGTRKRRLQAAPVQRAINAHCVLPVFVAMNAPILAAMIGGIDSTPNTITPRGNRLPGPGEMSIQTNCPTIGSTPHHHERLGSTNANAIETKQTAGIPTEKYKLESHASFRPDTSAITIQMTAPQPAAVRYNQYSLFIRASLIPSGCQ